MVDETVKLLREIRDLLIPVSVAAQPQYEAILRQRHQRDIATITEIIGRSQSQQEAASLMDGTRTANEIRKATSFDPSNFGKFMAKLRQANVLVEDSGKIALTVPVSVLAASKGAKP